uniref:Uncharacterized protein n=1 Tax=viral metagenome TaxID=1070528 RepID=A0A6C0I3H4_9ZZZZ
MDQTNKGRSDNDKNENNNNNSNDNPVTMVTAFFDINREEKGDGRSIDEYKEWLKKTLQLNCNLFIVTEEKFRTFFLENRPPQYAKQTHIKVIEFADLHYYRYYDDMKAILERPEYKSRIAHPNRVECRLPEYNIIQYSKFHCLKMAMERDVFQSTYFLWMDAGCSRFFLDVDLSLPYPSMSGRSALKDTAGKFMIQKRQDLETFPIVDDQFIWLADNLLYGTLFGGNKKVIHKMAGLVERTFQRKMLANNNVNNEQLALALVWKENPELFYVTENSRMCHLILFKLLAL